MRRCGPGFRIKIFFGIFFFGLLMTIAVMFLWNWLIPSIFNIREITFLEALGLIALSKILFGFRGGWGKGRCCHGHGPRGYWRKRWEQKLANMTPEEREKAKEKYKKCYSRWSCDDGDQEPQHENK